MYFVRDGGIWQHHRKYRFQVKESETRLGGSCKKFTMIDL
jgi:hypothetical protein